MVELSLARFAGWNMTYRPTKVYGQLFRAGSQCFVDRYERAYYDRCRQRVLVHLVIRKMW